MNRNGRLLRRCEDTAGKWSTVRSYLPQEHAGKQTKAFSRFDLSKHFLSIIDHILLSSQISASHDQTVTLDS